MMLLLTRNSYKILARKIEQMPVNNWQIDLQMLNSVVANPD
jgi:hypothetical protein